MFSELVRPRMIETCLHFAILPLQARLPLCASLVAAFMYALTREICHREGFVPAVDETTLAINIYGCT